MKTLPLSKGKVALVDDEDYEELSRHKWSLSSMGYAYRTVNQRAVWMHRVIMCPPDDLEVDHINGDRADNRRSNLRICTHAENIRNQRLRKTSTSGYRGVSYFKRDGTWQTSIGVDGKKIHIGYFPTAEAAARAYDAAALRFHGPFARLNFSEG